MSPAPNSEARKRGETPTVYGPLIDGADPVTRLRDAVTYLRRDVDGATREDRHSILVTADLLDEIADQVVPRPPTVSEIIAAIDRGDRVEEWAAGLSEWRAELYGVRWWWGLLNLDGDLPQPGYRVVPDSRIENDQ